MSTIARRIAEEIKAAPAQVEAAIALLDGGSTVPFVARYRKEATGGLDDAQLRTLEERLAYLRDLEARRAAILAEIEGQGRLDPPLLAALRAAETKARLEDLYLPFRPRRRTRAQIAREAGLQPLAERLLADPGLDPVAEAAAYVDAARDVADVEAALAGARAIVTERLSEDAALVGELREAFWKDGRAASRVKEGKEAEGAKFADYFDFSEPFARMPSHRVLALLRGEKDGVLDIEMASPEDGSAREPGAYDHRIARRLGLSGTARPGERWLRETAGTAWRHRIRPAVSEDARTRLKEAADVEAIRVFGTNVRDLLMAAPAGARPTLGLDPGIRTGVKVAALDATGKVLETATVYPHEPRREWREAIRILAALCRKHRIELVAVGNGTASRETDRLVADLAKEHPELRLTRAMVSESGASIYSASAYASEELPGLDVTLRGAVSIARRLQDPLAELVKIDPKSIGVGQYQHDVDQFLLGRKLDAVVEDCVNAVGVDVNTASAKLLARVSGLRGHVAAAIVAHRDVHGPFANREALRGVPGLGPKAFEQAAGFLRVRGDDPLDLTGVHPEAYPLVRRILDATGLSVRDLMGNAKALRALHPERLACERFGIPTVRDVLLELEKPGRDPRPAFASATFKEGVERIEDLRPGMVLEGVVTNVAAFGAFVDVGVHQDGLVHVSALSRTFVRDPSQVVRPGQVVRCLVLDVDVVGPRKRIALSLRLDDEPTRRAPGARDGAARPAVRPAPSAPREPSGGGALAAAFARAGSRPGEGRRGR